MNIIKNAKIRRVLVFALFAFFMTAAFIVACAPIKILNINLQTDKYIAVRDVSYGTSARNLLDFYVPVARYQKTAGARPVIVWVYGGGWDSGSKTDYEFIAAWLTALGYSVVIPDYRLYPDARFPDFVEDIAAALLWVAGSEVLKNSGADISRIVLMGHSAGAYNAAMVALDPVWLDRAGAQPSIVAGFVGLAGPYDFYPYDVSATRNAFGHVSDPDITQPVRRIGAASPPTLLLHGEKDAIVYPRNSRALLQALEGKGAKATLVMLKNMDHKQIVAALSPILSNESVRQPIETFLNEISHH